MQIKHYAAVAIFWLMILGTIALLMNGCTTEEEMWETVVKAYGEDVERVLENARLLWLRRYDDQMWEPPKLEE